MAAPEASGAVPDEDRIRDVWADSLEEEFVHIRDMLESYSYVAMDTEFPGVVVKPVGTFRSTSDYQYQTLKCNVDLLKIIQLGITLSDSSGRLPEGVCTWQFHFKFSLRDDASAQDSIDLLTTAGIAFDRHESEGIDVMHFGELLTTSGLVLTTDVNWISFHSYYDFGYLLSLLTCQDLPTDEDGFYELLRLFFPCVYDIKYLMKSCESLRGGLNRVADFLQVRRIGPSHQAGSDSLVTSKTFFRMREQFFEDEMDDSKYKGVLYGLAQTGQSATVPWSAEY